ncbi:MAG TPA: pentapeptide repeat-containing protein [Aggregatilineales bacterium]|nr:pentapeptide repeat-containing protein [Anaerolineales bacterium]HRE47372.1 pentapeptide repeat-containing protein [Aggregatilineales bacterium]
MNKRWLLLIGGVLLILTLVPTAWGLADQSGSKIADLALNFGSGMAGTFITFLLFNWLLNGVEKRLQTERDVQKLLLQARSKNRVDTYRALLELNVDGLLSKDASLLESKDFSEADWTEAALKGCGLRNVILNRTTANAADFRDADLRGARFLYATLRGAIFSRANLERVDFSHADLTGAKLANALNLQQVEFTGATMPNGIPFDAADQGVLDAEAFRTKYLIQD